MLRRVGFAAPRRVGDDRVCRSAPPVPRPPTGSPYLDQGQLFVLDGDGRSLARDRTTATGRPLPGRRGRRTGVVRPSTSRPSPWFSEGLTYRNQDPDNPRADGSGDRGVFTVRLCCNAPLIAVAGQFVSAPTWSPDGSRIAFIVTTVVCPSSGRVRCGIEPHDRAPRRIAFCRPWRRT